MKSRLVVFLLILLTCINVAGFGVLLQRHFTGCTPQAMHRRVHRRINEELGLTEQQARHFRTIRSRFREETAILHDSLRQTQQSLISHLRNSEPDTVQIDTLIHSIADLQAAIHRHAVFSLLREKAELAPNQQEKLMKMFEHHVGKRPCFHRGAHCPKPGRLNKPPREGR